MRNDKYVQKRKPEDIKGTMDLALGHHMDGRLNEAKALYQEILEENPNHVDALHLSGVLAHQEGKNNLAIKHLQKALSINPNLAEAQNNLGSILKAIDKPKKAISHYLEATRIKPDYIDAHFNLSKTFFETGDLEKAISHCQTTINLSPENSELYFHLANIFQETGDRNSAIAAYQKSIQIEPRFAEAHYNLGNLFLDAGLLDRAQASFRKAVTIKPSFADAHFNLGNVLVKQNQTYNAIKCYKTALSIEPGLSIAHLNLGNISAGFGHLEQALKSFKEALSIDPHLIDAHLNLGNTYDDLGLRDEAARAFEQIIKIEPTYLKAHINLGILLTKAGKFAEAGCRFRAAKEIDPNYAPIYFNLANLFMVQGNLEECLKNFEKARAIDPNYALAHSSLLLTENYRPNHDVESLHKLHCEWQSCHAEKFQKFWPNHDNNRDPLRQLRVGFVSQDFGRHPVGYFISGMLGHLKHHKLSTFLYSSRRPDDLTLQIKRKANFWRDTRKNSDLELAKCIVDDQIDVLIDLSGHSAGNRLLVFAQKPAPVQISWAGYVSTTGLKAMDYLISDSYSILHNEEKYYEEEIIRMPNGWLCYEPPNYAPSVSLSPFKKNNYITFCSFNNPVKINEGVILCWAQILKLVYQSKLLIKYVAADSKFNIKRIQKVFKAEGVSVDRIIFEGRSPHQLMLERYNDVDIALDTFPYSGGLTTLEALWMGIPVITLPEKTFASRHSQSHLSELGLSNYVASSKEGYIALANALANDTKSLESMRSNLREMLARSPICNHKLFAKNFATLIRRSWQKWCSQEISQTSNL